MVRSLRPPAVLVQAMSVIVGMGLLALWPPQRGAMLLVSLSRNEVALVDAIIVANGRVLGSGPIAGSIVVRGDRERIVRAARRYGLLVTAARPAWCGQVAGGASS